MDSESPRIAILRMEGTNNDHESFRSFLESGALPQYVHIRELETGKIDLENFKGVFIPGGFSAGDYVRAGIIFAMRLKASAGKTLWKMAEQGIPIVGHCNGFQVLTELGMLTYSKDKKDVVLDVNQSGRFECRIVYVKYTGKNKILDHFYSRDIPMEVPVAHKEGRLRFSNSEAPLNLSDDGRITFTYVDPDGNPDGYPWNPNGSPGSIAGISGLMDNILGMMPHPERMYYGYQQSYSQRKRGMVPIGKSFFDAIVSYARTV